MLRRFRASGVSAGAMVGSESLLGVVLGTVSVRVVLAAGAAVYGLRLPSTRSASSGWYLAGLICFIAIGLRHRIARAHRLGPPPRSATSSTSRCSCSAAAARPAR